MNKIPGVVGTALKLSALKELAADMVDDGVTLWANRMVDTPFNDPNWFTTPTKLPPPAEDGDDKTGNPHDPAVYDDRQFPGFGQRGGDEGHSRPWARVRTSSARRHSSASSSGSFSSGSSSSSSHRVSRPVRRSHARHRTFSDSDDDEDEDQTIYTDETPESSEFESDEDTESSYSTSSSSMATEIADWYFSRPQGGVTIGQALDAIVQQVDATRVQNFRSNDLSVRFVGEPGVGDGPVREFFVFITDAMLTDNGLSGKNKEGATLPSFSRNISLKTFSALDKFKADDYSLAAMFPLFMPSPENTCFVVRPSSVLSYDVSSGSKGSKKVSYLLTPLFYRTLYLSTRGAEEQEVVAPDMKPSPKQEEEQSDVKKKRGNVAKAGRKTTQHQSTLSRSIENKEEEVVHETKETEDLGEEDNPGLSWMKAWPVLDPALALEASYHRMAAYRAAGCLVATAILQGHSMGIRLPIALCKELLVSK